MHRALHIHQLHVAATPRLCRGARKPCRKTQMVHALNGIHHAADLADIADLELLRSKEDNEERMFDLEDLIAQVLRAIKMG